MMKTACIKCGFFVAKKNEYNWKQNNLLNLFILLVAYDILKTEGKFIKKEGQNET